MEKSLNIDNLPPESTPLHDKVKTPDKIDIGDRYIYEPSLLEEIRATFAQSRVIVIDVNGVLMNNPFKREETLILNPQAESTLKSLKQLGYTLVIWSSGDQLTSDFIKNNGIDQYFDLVVYRDNYVHFRDDGRVLETGNIYYPIDDYNKAVESTVWLQDFEKKIIHSETSDSGFNLYLKTPQVLFQTCLCIDDDPNYIEQRLKLQDVEALRNQNASEIIAQRLKITNIKYPYLQVKRFPHFTSGIFSTDIIQQVTELFPIL
ncbi:hypothetical protein HGA88_02065 [Candidatus Roizmanbacteria bacterium]|nr:hypothetical protein [Candidatus Roizmanbacteria bacterium]